MTFKAVMSISLSLLNYSANKKINQNFVLKVRLVFQSSISKEFNLEITDWTFVESLKIISRLKKPKSVE